jgi:hypothetical protein
MREHAQLFASPQPQQQQQPQDRGEVSTGEPSSASGSGKGEPPKKMRKRDTRFDSDTRTVTPGLEFSPAAATADPSGALLHSFNYISAKNGGYIPKISAAELQEMRAINHYVDFWARSPEPTIGKMHRLLVASGADPDTVYRNQMAETFQYQGITGIALATRWNEANAAVSQAINNAVAANLVIVAHQQQPPEEGAPPLPPPPPPPPPPQPSNSGGEREKPNEGLLVLTRGKQHR